MPYYAYMDPENAVDTDYYVTYKADIAEALAHSDEDREEIAGIIADYMTGMKDEYAARRLIRTMIERAESIIERSKE